MHDSIIFDMDGTLVNNVRVITDAWRDICIKHGWTANFRAPQIQNIMGLTAKDIGKMLFPDYPEGEASNIVNTCIIEEIEYVKKHIGPTYVPNKEFLKKLSKKYKLFIVSNCLEGYIETYLEQYGFEKYFIDFRHATKDKAKADNIKDIVKEYNLKNPLYVGDTIWDRHACEKAGVEFVLASYGFGFDDKSKSIEKLEDLLQ